MVNPPTFLDKNYANKGVYFRTFARIISQLKTFKTQAK